MNKLIVTALAVATAAAMQAKQLENPDPNTLWMEDGKEIAVSPKYGFKAWYPERDKKKLEIKSKEDGKGFRFYAGDANGRKAGTKVKFSPEYPYLVFRVTDFEILKKGSLWTLRTELGNMIVGQKPPFQKGIFVFDLYRNLPEETDPKKSGTLNLWLNNVRLDLEYIKLVKKPDYTVLAECSDPEIKPGSTVKFTAKLAEEAEDVSITLFSAGVPRPIKVNGGSKIQLKPTDNTLKTWTAEIVIEKVDLKKPLKRFKSFMKMDVLGGALDEPVWVGLPYSIEM